MPKGIAAAVNFVAAALLLGEPIHWNHAVSGSLIIAGIVIATRESYSGERCKNDSALQE